MSLDSVFAGAYQGGNVSASLQRRLRLLQTVLPSFASAATQLFFLAKQFSPTRAFWTDFLSPCLVMESSRWRFNQLDDEHDVLVSRLLESLEKIVVMDKSTIAEEFAWSAFPRLETLRQSINNNSSDANVVLIERWNIAKPQDRQARSDIIDLLVELAEIVKDNSRQPPREEAVLTTSRSRTSIAPLLVSLFSTMSEYFRCNCTKPHKAMLLLFTHRLLPEDTDSHSFTMLLSRRSGNSNSWQETGVAIKEQIPKPKIQIIEPTRSSFASPSNEALSRVANLCAIMSDKKTTSRLNLMVDGEGLFQLDRTDSQVIGPESIESVSLADGLFGNETELLINSKTCLAVVLSYSFLDFCWEPWFPGGWTKEGITLLQYDDRKLLLRPALVTYIHRHSEASSPSKIPRDLKLLFHGVLLIEIFKQAPLPIKMSPNETVNIDGLRQQARREFDAVRWDVSEAFRQSVEACIDGFQDNEEDTSAYPEEDFAADFCKKVIAPLESDFISLWGDKDPDQVLSELRLPSIKSRRDKPPIPKPKPDHLKRQHQKPARPTKSKPSIPTLGGHVLIPPTSRRLQLKFFDVDDQPDPKGIQGAAQWFARFDQACADQDLQSLQKTRKKAPIRGRGIKIAILDTGIDLNNPWIASMAGRIKCWPAEDICKDTDGHGTHVAYLILRLAPLVQLRVAKVSKSQLLNDADIERIAEAIKHFSSVDRVDIINLSFGFPTFHERLAPIRDALRDARNNNVLLFAAAGNEGGNEGVSWPAKLPEVICINASDSYGNATGFSPTDGTQRQRICTLGDAVPSCEPEPKSSSRNADDDVRTIHRSGTSFATPIATSIAAMVQGFMNAAGSGDIGMPEDFEWLKSRLWTRSGMQSVLCKTCVLQGDEKRAGYSYIAPWFFLGIEESSRVGIITNELRNCPE